MSYPVLYSATETNFEHNGTGILSSCLSCVVTEEANGIFELSITYPVDGIHFEEIADRAIIKAKADQFRDSQLFRVYAISKPMSGVVTVLAEHISYDLSGIPVKPFSAPTASSAMSGFKNNAVVDCPFEFWTDKSTSAKFIVSTPASIRSRLGGSSGSILDVYGGEYEFDNFTVRLHNSRGRNRGVSIRYGKNLTDIKQDQNCSNVATGVYPYWAGTVDEKDVLVELPERVVNAPGTYNFVKIRTLDLSREFETQPTVDQLREKTESYIKNNNIGVPSVSWSVSFEQLSKSEEYKHLALFERVSLFDTVNVEFPALGVSATAKVAQIVYNVLLDRIERITLGDARTKISDTVASQQSQINSQIVQIGQINSRQGHINSQIGHISSQQSQINNQIGHINNQIGQINDLPSKQYVQDVANSASVAAIAWLTNGKGYKVERRDENGNAIDTLYMDTPDIETAVNVLRIGQSGIGFSRSGVNGPYYSAWTLDGKFNADFITDGTLYGLLFKAGKIESLDGLINIDLSGGGKDAVFNSGLQTNNKIAVKAEDGSWDMFVVERKRSDQGKEYFDFAGYNSASYDYVFHLTRSFDAAGDAVGTNFEVTNGQSRCEMSASQSQSSIMASAEGAGSVEIGVNTERNATYLMLNDGTVKDLSWEYSSELGKYVLCGE